MLVWSFSCLQLSYPGSLLPSAAPAALLSLTLTEGLHLRILSLPAGEPPLPELPTGMTRTRSSALHPLEADVFLTHHHSETAGGQAPPSAHAWDRAIALFLPSPQAMSLLAASRVPSLSSSHPASAHSLPPTRLPDSVFAESSFSYSCNSSSLQQLRTQSPIPPADVLTASEQP